LGILFDLLECVGILAKVSGKAILGCFNKIL